MRLLFRLIALAGIMAAAVFVGRGLLPSVDRGAATATPEIQVRIASRSLPAGTFLDEPEAPFTVWHEPVSPEMVANPVASGHDVIGAVIIAPITAGQPILRSQLLLPGQDGFLAAVLHVGMRAVSVAVDAVSGNAGHIFPGDRVDLILTQTLNARDPSARSNERWASETILRDVRVIAVDQSLRADMTQRDPSRVARTITLEVLPKDAEKVALAAGLGKLSLSLRSLLVTEAVLADGTDDAMADPAQNREPPDAPPPRRATWASDVSVVVRNAAVPPPATAPSAPRNVRVFRGKARDDVAN